MKKRTHILALFLVVTVLLSFMGGYTIFAVDATEKVVEVGENSAVEFVVELAEGMQVNDVALSVSDDQETWSNSCKASISIEGNTVTYLVHSVTAAYVRAQWEEGAELLSSAAKDYTPAAVDYTGFQIRGDKCLEGYGTMWSSSSMTPDPSTENAFLAPERQVTGTTFGNGASNFVVVNTLNMDEVTVMTNWVRSVLDFDNIRFYGVTDYPEDITAVQSGWDWEEITDYRIEAELGVSTDWEVLDFILDTEGYAFIKYEWDFDNDNPSYLSRLSGMKAVRGTERTMESYGELAWVDEIDDYSKVAAYSENRIYIEEMTSPDYYIRQVGDKFVRAFTEEGPYELVWSAEGTQGMVFDTAQSHGVNPNVTEDWENLPLIYTTTSAALDSNTVWTQVNPTLSVYRENIAAKAGDPIASYYVGGDVRKNSNVQLYVTYGEAVTYVKFAFRGATANTPVYATQLYKVAAIEREVTENPGEGTGEGTGGTSGDTTTAPTTGTTAPSISYKLLLHDDMEDFEKMVGYSANMVYNDYNEEQPHFFEEYWNKHCVNKFAGGPLDSWIMYDITGAAKVDVAALIAERAVTDPLGIEPNHLIFEVSKDQKNWTKVTPDTKLREETGKWTEAKYSLTDIPEGMKYLRITLYVPEGVPNWCSRVYSVDIYGIENQGNPGTGEPLVWPLAVIMASGAAAAVVWAVDNRRKATRSQ